MQVVITFFKRIIRLVLIMAMTIAILAGAVVLIAPQARRLVSAHRSDHARINLDPLAERSLIYDRNGTLLATLHLDQNRAQVPLRLVSKTVIQAIIAVEDEHFYQHKGVNARSIGRALSTNLDTGKVSQGGSTITQQVVKNSLVGNKRNFSRKVREAVLAIELEKQMTKNQILERYVNTVYFGNGAYGVQAAAQVYFDKDAATLNWAEGAMLAALVRSPNQYDPFSHPAVARRRRDLVFRRLVETHKLSPPEVRLYQAVPLPTKGHQPQQIDDYFVSEVKDRLLTDPRFGLGTTAAARYHAVYQGGLRIHTTFDPVAQFLAVSARNQTMLTVPGSTGDGTFPLPGIETKVGSPNFGKPNFGTEAMVSIEPATGAVRVMVAGPGFKRSPYNLATSPQQPGSSMKAYVLATLFNNGYVPSDLVSGSSCSFVTDGTPPVYSVGGRAGVDTITGQTKRSSNCAFLRLGQIVGLPKVIDMAKRLGVTSNCTATSKQCLRPNVSLPLGTSLITPFDMAAAYSVFANDGLRNEPYFVDRIEDRTGKVIYQHQLSPELIVPPQTARLVTQVLAANVQGGTGTRAQITTGQPAAGKTGTTNNSADVWFVGYTPQLATAIWMGGAGSTEIPMNFAGGATGGKFPALTWGVYMKSILTNVPIVPFRDPDPTRGGILLKQPYQVRVFIQGNPVVQTVVPGTPPPAPLAPVPTPQFGLGTGTIPPAGPGQP